MKTLFERIDETHSKGDLGLLMVGLLVGAIASAYGFEALGGLATGISVGSFVAPIIDAWGNVHGV